MWAVITGYSNIGGGGQAPNKAVMSSKRDGSVSHQPQTGGEARRNFNEIPPHEEVVNIGLFSFFFPFSPEKLIKYGQRRLNKLI